MLSKFNATVLIYLGVRRARAWESGRSEERERGCQCQGRIAPPPPRCRMQAWEKERGGEGEGGTTKFNKTIYYILWSGRVLHRTSSSSLSDAGSSSHNGEPAASASMS